MEKSHISPGSEEMKELLEPTKVIKHFSSWSIGLGILLVIIGGIGIVLPQVMSIEAVVFIAVLFLLGGSVWLIHAYRYSAIRWSDWLKPVLLLVSGVLMLFYPMSGVMAVGLLLAIYLLLDTFGSFTVAYGLYPEKGWGWMVINGIASLALALLFLIGWPETSLWLVGLFVAINLLFDGLALIFIGLVQRQLIP